MKNNEIKKETVDMINQMIDHADKGPSGFWTDDHEGCGNPDIFPEFNEGLKHGKLVQKEHLYCPWNTAIMYGDGHGNISNGCYYSCSIGDAKYLSTPMIEAALKRFKKRINAGIYDNVDHIEPLLTADEQAFISKEKQRREKERTQQLKRDTAIRKEKASKLLKKYDGNSDIQTLISVYYGANQTVNSEKGGLIFFNPDSMKDVVGAENITYDDYIDAQIKSAGNYRVDFLNCYMNIAVEFKGEIEKIDSANNRICFKRIFVTGMFSDGTYFDGKEDHVWMDKKDFGECAVGDCFVFGAEVYRYLKKSNGKMIDYSLHNPSVIEKINKYDLPTDKELAIQSIDMIICETCYLSEQCSHLNCIRNAQELKTVRNSMLKSLGKFDKNGNKIG